jgi:hypothetical protein
MATMRCKMPVLNENVRQIPVQKPHAKLQTVKVSAAKAMAMAKIKSKK